MKTVTAARHSVHETFGALRSNPRDAVKVWRKNQYSSRHRNRSMAQARHMPFKSPCDCRACETVKRAPRHAGRGLIWLYRSTLSPLIGFHCRHVPTCSAYGDEAIERFGLWAGGWMTLARLLRCQPWGTSGLDFVPKEKPAKARWYLPWRYGRWRGVNDTPE
jgi:putative membrane protein insertion efficiency factor